MDQETGKVTTLQQKVPFESISEDVIQAEWTDSGETLLFEAAEAVEKNSLWTVSRSGGEPAHFHEFGSDKIHSGVGVSPGGRWAAYIDRAADGFCQVFWVPLGGGDPEPVTSDPTHKTQPA